MEMTRSLKPTGCEAFRQHLKSCASGSPCPDSSWHGFDVSDNPEMYMEERRKCQQARLARSLRKVNERRLLTGYNPRTGYAFEKQVGAEDVSKIKRESVEKGCSSRKGGAAAQEPPVLEQLILEKQNKVIKLSDVELIFPKGGVAAQEPPALEQLILEKQNKVIKLSDVELIFPKVAGAKGTLEAHVNGFLFTSCVSSFNMHFLFKDIKDAFFRLSDGSSPPLLHFHVNGEKIKKDIVVHLQKKYEDRNDELGKFVFDVEDKWMCTEAFADLGPIQELMDEKMFFGYLPPEEEVVFTLTFFSIRVNVSPFIVVDYEDIEIVNFVELGNGLIKMTVIPNDFKVESMFEIRFPSESLAAMKDWLYRGRIKYYVNKVDDWTSRVKEIAENFQTFLEHGGWAQYELEDNATVQDYYSMTSESESEASDAEWGEDCSESDSKGEDCSESDSEDE